MGRIRRMQGSPRSLDQRKNSERKLTQHLTQTPSCEVLSKSSKKRSVMKVDFIGLGIMGRPMAGHLVKAGHELYVHDLRPAPQDLLDQGARDCRSGREVAEQAEVIITMVPDTPHVEAALFGPGGVAEGLKPGKIVVDMSSIAP